MGLIRRGTITLFVIIIACAAYTRELSAQNHTRFLEVDKWKITYSITIKVSQVYPRGDSLNWNILLQGDPDTYSLIVENSTLEGTLIFDEREGSDTWIGEGSIIYKINSGSRGAMGGSSFNGSMTGSGTTTLCRDESWFSIDVSSGTYELLLIPGDGDRSGMTVHVSSDNSVWTDMANQMREKFGNVSEEILTDHLGELLEPNTTSEPDDAFYCSDPERWMVDVEYAPLPSQGLLINGERDGWGGEASNITWKIEPLQ